MPRPPKTQKPKSFKRSLQMFWASLKPYRLQLLFPILFAILSNVLSIFTPTILGNMTNSALSSLNATGHVDFAPIRAFALQLGLIYLIAAVLSYFESYLLGRLTAFYTKSLRAQIIEKISRLPISYHDQHKFGDTLSVLSNDVDALSTSLSEEIVQIITNLTTLVGCVVLMLTISVQLSVVTFLVIPFSVFVVSKIAQKAQTHFKAERSELAHLNSHIEEDYSGQQLIKVYSHVKASTAAFLDTNEKLYQNAWRANFLGGLAFPLVHLFTNLGYVVICMLGGNLVLLGRLSIGGVQAFLQYVSRFNSPLTNLSQIIAQIQSTLAAAERVFTFLAESEESPDPVHPKFPQKIRGEIEFSNVSFSYDKKTPVIKNFSAKIKPGQQVAIVGPTGAGKTTLINLLMRFYDPDSGYITIDGVPTSEMKRSDVRNLFGMVLQDTWLFSGTIKDNLAYGRPSATLKEIRTATKSAGIHHLIASMQSGYKTEISEDSDNVSAGEKQLLTITRAMIKNPPMMILDEATSNVDTRAEQLIQEAFNKLTKNRTSFVIAHRLSTIRNADLILVIKDGNICEQGTHDTLLKKNGFYAKLYNSQFSNIE